MNESRIRIELSSLYNVILELKREQTGSSSKVQAKNLNHSGIWDHYYGVDPHIR